MLTQTEANTLIATPKSFLDMSEILLRAGANQTRELVSDDKRERFLIDLWRGTFRLSRVRYQNRGRKIIVLVRVDIDGPPHTNPDGQKIGGNHIHVYREGFEDRWAEPLSPDDFGDPGNIVQVFDEFCRFCHVGSIPSFQGELL